MLVPLLHILNFFGTGTVPPTLQGIVALGLVGLTLGLSIISIKNGLPRWSFLLVGTVLTYAIYLLNIRVLYGLLLPRLIPPTAPLVVRFIVPNLLFWGTQLIVVTFIVLVASLWQPLKPFYKRIRHDWTLLSFGLYGITLFLIDFAFDENSYEKPYAIMGALILAVGAWVYLRQANPWRRILTLAIGATLAIAVASIGKGLLYSNPNGPFPGLNFSWQTEAMRKGAEWAGLMIVLFAPGLLTLLPDTKRRLQAE